MNWIWSSYTDLTRPGPPKGSLVGEVPKRFVNYHNLPRWMAILEPSLWRDLSTGQCCSWILSKSVATNEPIPVESSTPKGERWGNQILYFCMVGDLSSLWMDVVGVLDEEMTTPHFPNLWTLFDHDAQSMLFLYVTACPFLESQWFWAVKLPREVPKIR